MKQFLFLILCVISFNISSAQTESIQENFEGEILIRVYQYYPKEAQKVMQCHSGVDTVRILIKGEKIISYNKSTQVTSIINPNSTITFYPLIQKGIETPTIIPDNDAIEMIKQSYTFINNENPIKINGVECNIIIAQKSDYGGTNIITLAIAKNSINLPYSVRQLLDFNMISNGIAMRTINEHKKSGTANSLSKIGSLMTGLKLSNDNSFDLYHAQEIISITKKPIDSSNFEIPNGIKLEKFETNDIMSINKVSSELQKKNYKYLRSKKLLHEDSEKRTFAISDDWNL